VKNIFIASLLTVCTAVYAGKKIQAPVIKPAYAIWNVDNGTLIDSSDSGSVRPIASITKIMSAFVVLNSDLNMDELLLVTGPEKSRYIRRGMLITRSKLVELSLVSSDNLAARTLAETHPAGYHTFIDLMNQTARNLGMQNTQYTDSTGLLSTNRSTLGDLNKLVLATQNFPVYRMAANTQQLFVEAITAVKNGAKRLSITGKNTNTFAGKLDIISAKTGYTSAAGRCLTMLINRDGNRYLLVVLGASSPEQRRKIVEGLIDKI